MNLFIKQKQTRRLENKLLLGMGENRGKVIGSLGLTYTHCYN